MNTNICNDTNLYRLIFATWRHVIYPKRRRYLCSNMAVSVLSTYRLRVSQINESNVVGPSGRPPTDNDKEDKEDNNSEDNANDCADFQNAPIYFVRVISTFIVPVTRQLVGDADSVVTSEATSARS